MISRLDKLAYERRMKESSWFSLAEQMMKRNMIIIYKKNEIKKIRRINIREGGEPFKIKDNVDRRTNGYKMAMNKTFFCGNQKVVGV